MLLIRMLKTMLQKKHCLLHNNWNILIFLIILPCGLSHKESQVNANDNYYMQHHKLSNRAKNYITRLPVGDIIVYDDIDDNQNNFHKLSKHSDEKFNNQPMLHSFDRIQQRHQTPHTSDDKFMNRQLSHKHWGSKRSHNSRNYKHKLHRYANHSDNRPYVKGVMRYRSSYNKNFRNQKSTYSPNADNTKHYSNVEAAFQTVEKFRDNYKPPYIKKYNRRNKQLLDLLEGRPPSDERIKPKKHSSKLNHKKNQWVEANLFEEQRPVKKARNSSSLYESDHEINEIPEMNENDSDASSDYTIRNEQTNKNRSKSENFNYHRVASPTLVGFGSFGLLRKQQLPFVAITDKRLSHSSSRAYSQQPSNLSMP